MSPRAPAPAPIQRAPAQVASRMEEVVEKPIELVTADKDVKKKKKLASKTGTTAFEISNIRVKYPKVLLPVLKALVAPIFPDPIFLISFFKKNFVNK